MHSEIASVATCRLARPAAMSIKASFTTSKTFYGFATRISYSGIECMFTARNLNSNNILLDDATMDIKINSIIANCDKDNYPIILMNPLKEDRNQLEISNLMLSEVLDTSRYIHCCVKFTKGKSESIQITLPKIIKIESQNCFHHVFRIEH